MNTSVFEMVHQVLGDAKEKLARDASQGVEKKAAVQSQPSKTHGGTLSNEYLDKLSAACDHLAGNLHLVVDNRTPQEKLAEYAEINRALMKKAFEGGDKAHQSTEANEDSKSPHAVSLDESGTGVGGTTSIPSTPALTPGANPAEASGQGEATPANKPPATTAPTEKPNPEDASNAMETNKGMMMPTQPDDLLKQEGGSEANGKTAAARAQRTLTKTSAKGQKELQQKVAQAKRHKVLMAKAAQAGLPPKVAASLLRKMAEPDSEDMDGSQISAGTDPQLQSEPGVPSALSQGSEAGSNTPRGSAPTSGEGGGRELISSNEAAMNATKGQAKQQNKGALTELLTEPMQSSAHDETLQQSLDNTSSAGVKISAARELLKKMAASSPGIRKKVAMLVKKAEGEATESIEPPPAAPMAPPMAPPAGIPPEAAGGVGEAEGAGAMEAALAAVLAGVTPEDLMAAEELLAGEAGGGEMPAAGEGAAPEAGAEVPEKLQQFGGAGGAMAGGPGGMGAGPTGSPGSSSPTMA